MVGTRPSFFGFFSFFLSSYLPVKSAIVKWWWWWWAWYIMGCWCIIFMVAILCSCIVHHQNEKLLVKNRYPERREREKIKKKKKRKLLTPQTPKTKQEKRETHIFVYLKKKKKTRLFALLEWVTAPTFFHFMRRFWNQILICRSDRQRLWAISIRLLRVR